MVVWDLMACPFFEPSGTTTIATVKVAMMGHPDHGSVSGGDPLCLAPTLLGGWTTLCLGGLWGARMRF